MGVSSILKRSLFKKAAQNVIKLILADKLNEALLCVNLKGCSLQMKVHYTARSQAVLRGKAGLLLIGKCRSILLQEYFRE